SRPLCVESCPHQVRGGPVLAADRLGEREGDAARAAELPAVRAPAVEDRSWVAATDGLAQLHEDRAELDAGDLPDELVARLVAHLSHGRGSSTAAGRAGESPPRRPTSRRARAP